MYIDIYTHIFPTAFYQRMSAIAPRLGNIGKRMQSVTAVHDLDVRFRAMDPFGDYKQIISLPNPPIEDITTPEQGIELARIGNDTMAEMVEKNRDRFPGFVAALAMHSMDETMEELHRAVTDLGAVGVQIFTNVGGRPLDHSDYEPVFAAMADYDLPIWMHPARTSDMTDYAAEEKSRFEIWWALGWPYETSVAMVRLVLWGLFDRYPKIKILTHHLGGMIPYFEERVGAGLDVLGARTSDEDYSNVLSSLKKPHGEYFKMFYGDTAMFGSSSAFPSGLQYFGADNVVFSTDAPFAPVAETFESLKRMELEVDVQSKIYKENAERLMKRSFE
jgi:predicted TIM-barrel fold metal-dependent hydrolase